MFYFNSKLLYYLLLSKHLLATVCILECQIFVILVDFNNLSVKNYSLESLHYAKEFLIGCCIICLRFIQNPWWKLSNVFLGRLWPSFVFQKRLREYQFFYQTLGILAPFSLPPSIGLYQKYIGLNNFKRIYFPQEARWVVWYDEIVIAKYPCESWQGPKISELTKR